MRHEPYIRIVPGSDTAVLMVHGITGSPRHFDGVMEAVPGNWTVYNILLEGHGGSAEDFAKASMTAWRGQVRAALDELCGNYRRVFLVAHSMGTLLVMDAYREHREKIKGTLLLNSPMKIGVKPRMLPLALTAAFGLEKEDSSADVMKGDCGVELTKKLWVYLSWIPRYLELFHLVKECRKSVMDVEAPCVAIQSKHDELVSRKAIKYLGVNPKIQIYELERSGHFGYFTEEQEFINSKLKEILEGAEK